MNENQTGHPDVAQLALPPPTPTPLATFTANSSVWRTTDRSLASNNGLDSHLLDKAMLPNLDMAKFQMPLSTATSYAIGTNPLLAASFESNFSQFSLRSAARHDQQPTQPRSKFQLPAIDQNRQWEYSNMETQTTSGFDQSLVPSQQDNSEYLVPRLALSSNTSFA